MTNLLPCPFCDNSMLIEHGMIAHVDSAEFDLNDNICPIGHMSWEEQFLNNWNLRKGIPAGFVSYEDFMKPYSAELKDHRAKNKQ